jgi:hypothetical protein
VPCSAIIQNESPSRPLPTGTRRYYFPNKDELIASALWRVGERVDDRIRHRTAGGMTMSDLRIAATEPSATPSQETLATATPRRSLTSDHGNP